MLHYAPTHSRSFPVFFRLDKFLLTFLDFQRKPMNKKKEEEGALLFSVQDLRILSFSPSIPPFTYPLCPMQQTSHTLDLICLQKQGMDITYVWATFGSLAQCWVRKDSPSQALPLSFLDSCSQQAIQQVHIIPKSDSWTSSVQDRKKNHQPGEKKNNYKYCRLRKWLSW